MENINGTKHTITYCGDEILAIGCKHFTIAKWKEIYSEIGAMENYSYSQIKEYYNYILMAEMFYNSLV